MSRVGLKPIPVPAGVTVTIDSPTVTVKGPKGTLSRELTPLCKIKQEGDTIFVTRESDNRIERSMHGLTRTLVANMVEGVSQGFTKELEIVGVGYKAEAKGNTLVLTLGFSHPINFALPEGIAAQTPEPTKIQVSGIDKELVGQVAAEIRAFRKPEPYKGKGVKYVNEQVQRKAGKAGAAG